GAAIAGNITDDFGEPVVGTPVSAALIRPSGDGAAAAGSVTQLGTGQTDDLGDYRIGGLPAGDYIVSAGGGGDPNLNMTIMVNGLTATNVDRSGRRIYYPGVDNAAQAEPIRLAPGEERPAIDLVLPPNH